MPNQNISRLIKSKRKRGRRRLSNSKSKKNKNEDDFGSLNMAELSKMLEKMPSKQRKRVMKKLKKSAKSMNLQNMVNEHNNNHVHSHNCGCSHMTEEEIPQLVNSDFDNTLPVLEEDAKIPQLVNSDNVLPTLEEKKIQNDENHIKPPDNSQLLKLILQQNIKKEEVVEEVVPVVEEVVEETEVQKQQYIDLQNMIKSDFSDEASYQSNDSLYVHLPEDLLINNEESNEMLVSSSSIPKIDELINFIENLSTCEEDNTDRFTLLNDNDCDITNYEEKQMLKNEEEKEKIRIDEMERECKKLEEEEEEIIYI